MPEQPKLDPDTMRRVMEAARDSGDPEKFAAVFAFCAIDADGDVDLALELTALAMTVDASDDA